MSWGGKHLTFEIVSGTVCLIKCARSGRQKQKSKAHVSVIGITDAFVEFLVSTFTFTFMHLADAFIQSDLQCIQAIHVLSLCVFPGNRTHNLLRC